jgi:hypothetical protein
LRTPIGDRVVEPQPGVSWDAPFFFHDSRSVFYVTTREELVNIWTYPGFGFPTRAAGSVLGDVSPVVLQSPPDIPRPSGPVLVPSGPPIIDPAAIKPAIGPDSNIRVALGTTATVAYQGRPIGPTGSLNGVLRLQT